MQFHSKPTSEVIEHLGTDVTTGLTAEGAEERLSLHGKNLLKEKKKKSTFMKFVDQFKDAMILILIAAAALSFVLACIEVAKGGHGEFFEPMLILLIVLHSF